ncbi:Nuclear transcription factor Y subunit beta [Dirofilaria immitis]
MISEDDGNNYLNKYSQDDSTCQTEDSTTEDGSAERILSATSITSEENSMTRKPILEQDRFLPIANISRLMKNVIPRSGKVAKDAKECVQECVSEFISFITSEACDRCLNEKRKTITGEDIIGAFSTLGFDNYVEPLSAYVRKFREAFRTERSNETLLVESSGSHPSFMEKMNVRDSNESSTSDVFAIQTESIASSSACTPQIVFAGEEDPDGAIRVLSTGNVQHLQLLMDPSTGQHYINVQNPNGTQQLLPVQVTAVADSSSTPLTLACPDASQVTRHTGEQSRNGATYGLKHNSVGLSTTNQHKQQVPYVGNMGQFGHHHSNSGDASGGTREQPRKRSHESIDYITFE